MILRVASGFMALMFLISAALQYNDPDPIQWAAIYLAAAILSGLAAFRPGSYPWFVPALVAAIALVWASTIAPRVWGKIALGDIARTMEAQTPAIEESRETLGLLIIAVWMVVLAAVRWKRP